MDFIDEITLTGLRVFGRHGVYEHERHNGQIFVIDATLYVSIAAAAASDDVADTVHYGEVAERIAAIVGGEPLNLIETLAQRIADELLRDASVRMVSVTVHKPDAPIDLPFTDVSVTVRRAQPVGHGDAPSAVQDDGREERR
jgi:7,8-dihydroneopterin aldolase/epimerase/oxygenase